MHNCIKAILTTYSNNAVFYLHTFVIA